MRRTSARLASLWRHLQRTKWRDKQAAEAYWTLNLARKSSPPSINLTAMDEVLKRHYNDDFLRQFRAADNTLFAFVKKASKTTFRVDPVTCDVYGLEAWIPKSEEPTVPKYRCEHCDELIEITPNGADPRLTNRRQRLVLHPDKKNPGKLCPGGGTDV